MRAVWLPPDEHAALEKAVKSSKAKSKANYVREAIRTAVARDLAPRIPDLEDVQEKMRDLPPDIQRRAVELLLALMAHGAKG